MDLLKYFVILIICTNNLNYIILAQNVYTWHELEFSTRIMILLCPYGLVQVTVFVLKSVQQTNTVLWLVSVSVNTVLWLVEMWWVRSLDVGDMKTNTGEMFISTGLVHIRTRIISMMFIICQIFSTHDMFFYLLYNSFYSVLSFNQSLYMTNVTVTLCLNNWNTI